MYDSINHGHDENNDSSEKPFYDFIIINTCEEESSIYYNLWNLLIGILALISSQIHVFLAAYMVDLYSSRNTVIFYWIMEGCFAIDILVNFISDFEDPITRKQKRDIFSIFWNYASNLLLVDLLTNIPWYLVAQRLGANFDDIPEYGYNWAYLVYLVKYLRIAKAASIFHPKRA